MMYAVAKETVKPYGVSQPSFLSEVTIESNLMGSSPGKLTDGKYGNEAAWVIKKRDADAKKAREEAAKATATVPDTNAPAPPK